MTVDESVVVVLEVDEDFDGVVVFFREPALLRLTRLVGVFEPEFETELEVEDPERSNRLIRSFWVTDTRRTTGLKPEIPEIESGIFFLYFSMRQTI